MYVNTVNAKYPINWLSVYKWLGSGQNMTSTTLSDIRDQVNNKQNYKDSWNNTWNISNAELSENNTGCP